MRTFVVGDIHGEAERLAELLEILRARAEPGDTLVFLGDYISRGPDSRGVVDLVLAEQNSWPGRVVALKGNHEAMLLERLGLLSSAACLPAGHREFFLDLRTYYEDGHGFYVHAGIPPGRHPRECREGELLWRTYPAGSLPKPVVFGHEVQPGGEPLNEPHRIGLDTGCGFGGPLTAVILPERRFVQVI